ncbi:ribonuclease H-like domain-containing protein [Tanacetum coccineum]
MISLRGGLGMGVTQIIDGDLSSENDKFVLQDINGMHAVSPTHDQTQPSESESQTSEFDTCESNISTEPSELVSEPVVNESNIECQPKVWSDAPIIEEYESDSEDEYVSTPRKEQKIHSFANQQVKTPRETIKNQFTHSQKPKVDKTELGAHDWNKAYLANFKDLNGGPVLFGGSKELQHFNLFSVSQMCDKKNKVLFTDSECLVLSSEFKLPDENQVLLKIPRQNNMYSFNLENIVPSGGLTCLIAKATTNESNKWHRRLGHVNFKNINKLVKGNLVREFKNRDIIELCGSKEMKREYSNVRTPQQNKVAERKNRTIIKAARTILADSFLPNTFWAEAVSTTCYVHNRVLVTKP